MRLIFPALVLALACSACATAVPAPASNEVYVPLEGTAQEKLDALRPVVERDPAFAGLYVEGQTSEFDTIKRAVILFTGDAATRLRRYTRDPLFVAQNAATPYAALEKAQQDVTSAMQREKLYFLSSMVDVKKNVVVIDVVDERGVREAIQAGKFSAPGYVLFNPVGGAIAQHQAVGPVQSFVQSKYPAGAEMAALRRGTLAVMDGCIRLIQLTDKRGVLIVWPSAAKLSLDKRTDDLIIANPDTNSSVRTGQMIELGGGGVDDISQDALTAPLPAKCNGPFWIAGSTWNETR